MNHCVSKRLKAFLESFETRFANLILVFLETSGSPMDPEPHDWILSRPFLQGSTSGVSGSESNVDHDVRKPLGILLCRLDSGLGFDGSNSPLFQGSKVASNTMQRKGLFSPLRSMEPKRGSRRTFSMVSGSLRTFLDAYAREDSNPQPKVP